MTAENMVADNMIADDYHVELLVNSRNNCKYAAAKDPLIVKCNV